MYVAQRAGYDVITDPYAGTFGALIQGRDAGDYEGFGSLDTAAIIAALTPCGITAISDPAAAGECLWNAIQSIVASDESLLTALTTSDLTTALSAIGLPSEAVSAAQAVPHVTQVWQIVQGRARLALQAISYARGVDRPAAQGGGHTLVDANGIVAAVSCPGVVQDFYDETGALVGRTVQPPSYVNGNEPCPQSSSSSTHSGMVAAPPRGRTITRFMQPAAPAPSDGDQEPGYKAAPRWYRNKWTYIVGGVVLVGGGVAYAAMRRRGR